MLKKSRIATVLASLAVVSLAAPPAMANHRNWGGWGRHRDRIDTGDVVAGILILGGIAAVASAASNAKKKQRDRDDYRYPDNDYPQQRERSGGYADDDRSEPRDTRSGNGTGTGIDGAIDRCMDEVSRGSTKIDEVDSVNRDGDGWRVQGRTSGGGNFSCSIDGDGRIRNVNIDGRAI